MIRIFNKWSNFQTRLFFIPFQKIISIDMSRNFQKHFNAFIANQKNIFFLLNENVFAWLCWILFRIWICKEQFCNKATDVAISIEFISENCELWLINEHSKTDSSPIWLYEQCTHSPQRTQNIPIYSTMIIFCHISLSLRQNWDPFGGSRLNPIPNHLQWQI